MQLSWLLDEVLIVLGARCDLWTMVVIYRLSIFAFVQKQAQVPAG